MAGGAEKLSVAKIRAAKPHAKKSTASGSGPRWAKYGDGKGLWLLVGPTGTKHWRYIYTMNKRTRHLSLGEVDTGDIAASVDAARTKAREFREMTRLGIDPKMKLEAEKAERREAILSGLGQQPANQTQTFQFLAERYIEVKEADWADKTVANWKGTMRDYVWPTRISKQHTIPK
ncbi:Arm DNA-binding domain-containing protein [Altererythrobacter aquiaggeris]|uniref:Arm DNA-binding domain-containing protein n=1 Tax=Aestuarierythrobacter aquiaggeris TaxID=1898396 RepID=UPI0030163D7F